MGQIIAVVSGKGGTGKTTFTALVGLALAKLGRKTLLIDCDIALRDLDLALGLSDRALMDFSDVIEGRCTLEEAAVRTDGCPKLHLLAAPVSLEAENLTAAQMRSLLSEVRTEYDFCLIDASAGLGPAFLLSTCGADRVVVVSTTDPTALRNAQRTVAELSSFPEGSVHLVVNRVRRKLLRKVHATLDDAMDTAGLPLLGIIPEDEKISVALGRGSLLKLSPDSHVLTAARNIARRLTGHRIPLMTLPRF